MPFISFIFGLIIGSFLNVCIYRLPRKESLLWPGSHCPGCFITLKPVDLIPVVSFLIGGTKCSYCKQRISWQYPLIELSTGLIFFLIVNKFGFNILSLSYLLLASILIVATVIDFKLQIIPNELVLFGLIAGLVINIVGKPIPFTLAMTGMLFGGLIMLAIYILSRGRMGGGDIKFVAMIGVFVGWQNIFLVIFMSFTFGATISLILLISGIKTLKDPIPFGPFISLGTLVTINWGLDIMTWYLGLFH